MRFFLMLGAWCCAAAVLCGQDLADVYASLARADERLSDYRLRRRRGGYTVVHRSLPLKISSHYSQRYLWLEERRADNGSNSIYIQLFEQPDAPLICVVICNFSSDLECDNSIIVWQQKGKRWENISQQALPAQVPAAQLDNCPISVRQISAELPYSYLVADNELRYELDKEAIEKRCEAKKQEQTGGNTTPICDVMQCVDFPAIYYYFDQNSKRFLPANKK